MRGEGGSGSRLAHTFLLPCIISSTRLLSSLHLTLPTAPFPPLSLLPSLPSHPSLHSPSLHSPVTSYFLHSLSLAFSFSSRRLVMIISTLCNSNTYVYSTCPVLVSHIAPPFPLCRAAAKHPLLNSFGGRNGFLPQPRPCTTANEGLQINNISHCDTHPSVGDAASNMLSSSKLQENICLKTHTQSCWKPTLQKSTGKGER